MEKLHIFPLVFKFSKGRLFAMLLFLGLLIYLPIFSFQDAEGNLFWLEKFFLVLLGVFSLWAFWVLLRELFQNNHLVINEKGISFNGNPEDVYLWSDIKGIYRGRGISTFGAGFGRAQNDLPEFPELPLPDVNSEFFRPRTIVIVIRSGKFLKGNTPLLHKLLPGKNSSYTTSLMLGTLFYKGSFQEILLALQAGYKSYGPKDN